MYPSDFPGQLSFPIVSSVPNFTPKHGLEGSQSSTFTNNDDEQLFASVALNIYCPLLRLVKDVVVTGTPSHSYVKSPLPPLILKLTSPSLLGAQVVNALEFISTDGPPRQTGPSIWANSVKLQAP